MFTEQFIVPLYRLELVREKDIAYRPATKVEQAAQIFHEMLDSAHVEKLAMIHCNSALDMIGAEIVAIGRMERVSAAMSDLFRGAIRNNAAHIWMAHNHVDGNVNPSLPDFKFTLNAIDTGNFLEVPVVDHLVIGPGAHYSMQQHKEEFQAAVRQLDAETVAMRLLGMLPIPDSKNPFPTF